jgi:protein gp37
MGRPGAYWEEVWNPITGCSIASEGCAFCYAPRWAELQLTRGVKWHSDVIRFDKNGDPKFTGEMGVLPPGHPGWTWPVRWKGAKEPKLGPSEPSLIFVADMSDLFHERRLIEHIDRVVTTMCASEHIGLMLTRRASVMANYFLRPVPETVEHRRKEHLWLGTSCETQRWLDHRWPRLRPLAERGFITFLSLAPMLEAVRLPQDFLELGDRAWVVCSGEQGRYARPFNSDWARAVRDQCAAHHVPFNMLRCGRGQAIPPDLDIRQFPTPIKATRRRETSR